MVQTRSPEVILGAFYFPDQGEAEEKWNALGVTSEVKLNGKDCLFNLVKVAYRLYRNQCASLNIYA